MLAQDEPTFHPFQRLPAELRLAVWQLSCQPRVVEVWYDAVADRCRTTTRPPALVHTNREARAEALRLYYRRAFVTRSSSEHYIYFAPDLDTLYLPRHGLMGYDDTARDFTVHVRDTAEHVRTLAIDHVRTDTIRPWEPYNKLMLIFSFPNVQQTMLVVGAGSSSSSSSHDRRLVRRRSQESVESGASVHTTVSASSGGSSRSSSASGTKAGDVELVDPQGDTAMVMDVINNVIESFSREIQAATDGSPLDKDAQRRNSGAYAYLPYLIPKAKTFRRRHRQKRRYAIGCA